MKKAKKTARAGKKPVLVRKIRIGKDADYILYRDLSDNRLFAGSTYKRDNGNFAIHTSEGITDIEMAQSVRKQLLIDSGFDHLVTLKQVHSSDIHFVNRDNAAEFFQNQLIEGDGIVTNLDHVLIGVLTADCVPLVFTDRNKTFCGVAHAGWKGLKRKIHLKMLETVMELFHAGKEDITVFIGPHIRDCCYEVKKDVVNQLKTKKARLVKKSSGKKPSYLLNMEAVILDDLKKAGIGGGQVMNYPVCTKCSRDPAFYSYRNGDVKDRFLTFVGLI